MLSRGCLDVSSWYAFLCTIEVSLKNSTGLDKLLDTYSQALAVFEEYGPCQIEGLMNEQAGFDLARRGHVSEANTYFKRALHIHKHQWCSDAKYQWLLEEMAQYSTIDEKEEGTITPQIGNTIVCSNIVES